MNAPGSQQQRRWQSQCHSAAGIRHWSLDIRHWSLPDTGRPSVAQVVAARKPRHNIAPLFPNHQDTKNTKGNVECRSTNVEDHAGIEHSSLDIRHSISRGFTLVELLIVIAIIGILASLLLVAISAAMRSARVTAIKVEIDSLTNAVEGYKNERGTYPMNPTVFDTSEEDIQEIRFMRHIRKAFPRVVRSYDQLRIDIGYATGLRPSYAPPSPIDGMTDTEGLDIGDRNADPDTDMHLDAAEALVFWLGGLPVWTELRPGEFTVELTGFALDPQDPFQDRVDQPQRTQPLFEFKPERLTDYDEDGWPEYIPPGTAVTGEMPPYVYFDSPSYGMQAHYPPITAAPLVARWGVSIPYAASSGQAWTNPGTFQLIGAGLDGAYFTPDPGIQDYPTVCVEGNRPRDFPGNTLGNFTEGEFDNLSNFAQRTLGDAIEKARP